MKKMSPMVLSVCLLLCWSSAGAQEKTVTEKIRTYRTGIFHVCQRMDVNTPRNLKSLGTAFLLDNLGTLATAKHVLRGLDREKIVVRFLLPQNRAAGMQLVAKVVYESPDTDLAFLKVDLNRGPCKASDLYAFPMRDDFVKDSLVGERVVIIGHPTVASTPIDYTIVRTGSVASTEMTIGYEPMVLLDLIGVPGFSGSPVILERTGQVIGVVYGPGPTHRAFGFEWATPITSKDYLTAICPPKPQGQTSQQSL